MDKIDEKTIAIQTSLSLDLLGILVIQLQKNPEMTIREFITNFQKSINWDQNQDYSIVNQGVILTHLYGLIVYPKEVFKNDIPTVKLDQINKQDWGEFEFRSFPSSLTKNDKATLGVETVENEADMTLEFLIRKIRNSIGHARMVIYKNMDFEFNDQDGSQIFFNISGLEKFTAKFKKCYMTQNWT